MVTHPSWTFLSSLPRLAFSDNLSQVVSNEVLIEENHVAFHHQKNSNSLSNTRSAMSFGKHQVMDRKKMQELLALVSLQQQESGQGHYDEYRGGIAPAVSWTVKPAGASNSTASATGAGTGASHTISAGLMAGNGRSSRSSRGGASAAAAAAMGIEGPGGQASQVPPHAPVSSAPSSSAGSNSNKALAGQLAAVEKQFADYQAATRERVRLVFTENIYSPFLSIHPFI